MSGSVWNIFNVHLVQNSWLRLIRVCKSKQKSLRVQFYCIWSLIACNFRLHWFIVRHSWRSFEICKFYVKIQDNIYLQAHTTTQFWNFIRLLHVASLRLWTNQEVSQCHWFWAAIRDWEPPKSWKLHFRLLNKTNQFQKSEYFLFHMILSDPV